MQLSDMQFLHFLRGVCAVRFLVDLYRYLIIAVCGLVLIGLAYGIVSGIGSGLFDTGTGPLWIFGAVIVTVCMILGLGLVAIAISIHDRHAELVGEVSRLADLYEHRDINLLGDDSVG